MAEAYDVALALHCPLGPIALAACLQLDAVCYNALIQEQSLGIHYNKANDLLDYLADPTVFDYARWPCRHPARAGAGHRDQRSGGDQGRAKPAIAGARRCGGTTTARFAEW